MLSFVCVNTTLYSQSELSNQEKKAFEIIAQQQYAHFQNFYSVILNSESTSKDRIFASNLARKQFRSSSILEDVIAEERNGYNVDEYFKNFVTAKYKLPYFKKERKLVKDSLDLRKAPSVIVDGQTQKRYTDFLVYWEKQYITSIQNENLTKSDLESFKKLEFRIMNLTNTEGGYQLLFTGLKIYDKSNKDNWKQYNEMLKSSTYDLIVDEVEELALSSNKLDVNTTDVSEEIKVESGSKIDTTINIDLIRFCDSFNKANILDYTVPGLYQFRRKNNLLGVVYGSAFVVTATYTIYHHIQLKSYYNQDRTVFGVPLTSSFAESQRLFHTNRRNGGALIFGLVYVGSAFHSAVISQEGIKVCNDVYIRTNGSSLGVVKTIQ